MTEEKFYKLSEDTISMVNTMLNNISSFDMNVKYLGNKNLKCLIKLQKTNDVIKHLTGTDLIIQINEDYLIKLDEQISEILIYQELDRLEFNIEKGTVKINKYILQTNPAVLKKYGINAVAEANEITKLLTEQTDDNDFAVKTLTEEVKPNFEVLD